MYIPAFSPLWAVTVLFSIFKACGEELPAMASSPNIRPLLFAYKLSTFLIVMDAKFAWIPDILPVVSRVPPCEPSIVKLV